MHSFGDVVLCRMQFVDTLEVKTRPALVLFEEHGNIVVAGITSNKQMDGIPLSKEEGALKDSVIKLNYIFTVGEDLIKRQLFRASKKKRELIRQALTERLS